jgi:hypothetical protein
MQKPEDRQLLLEDVRSRRAFADQRARRYRRVDLTLLILSIVCGLLATALAADAANGGGVAAQQIAGNPSAALGPGWRKLCGLIAACSFLGTLAAALNSGLKLAEHRAQAMACAGRLDALHAELIASGDYQLAKDEFIRVLREYPQYLR